MYRLWPQFIGSVVFFIFCVIWIFIMHMICAWFLMFHLIFYNISHRIHLLTIFIKIQNEKGKTNIIGSKRRLGNKLRTCGYIFDQICLAFNRVASTFSLSVLFFLTILMFLSTTSLFNCYNNGYKLGLTYEASLNGWFFMHDFIMIIIILKAAESPRKEVTVKRKLNSNYDKTII